MLPATRRRKSSLALLFLLVIAVVFAQANAAASDGDKTETNQQVGSASASGDGSKAAGKEIADKSAKRKEVIEKIGEELLPLPDLTQKIPPTAAVGGMTSVLATAKKEKVKVLPPKDPKAKKVEAKVVKAKKEVPKK